jgi:hypothetical protein
MKWLALAGLPRVLAESDADPVAVPPRSIEQNCEVTIKEGMLEGTRLWPSLRGASLGKAAFLSAFQPAARGRSRAKNRLATFAATLNV